MPEFDKRTMQPDALQAGGNSLEAPVPFGASDMLTETPANQIRPGELTCAASLGAADTDNTIIPPHLSSQQTDVTLLA